MGILGEPHVTVHSAFEPEMLPTNGFTLALSFIPALSSRYRLVLKCKMTPYIGAQTL